MNELKTKEIKSLFLKYLIPSVMGTLSMGILVFIDTVFVGRGVGSDGLAALNTALPIFNIYTSTGLLLGMGGATAAALESGRGNLNGKNKIFTNCIILAVTIGLVVLPRTAGLTGVWLTPLFAESLTFILALITFKASKILDPRIGEVQLV